MSKATAAQKEYRRKYNKKIRRQAALYRKEHGLTTKRKPGPKKGSTKKSKKK